MGGAELGTLPGEPLKLVRQSSRVRLWLGCPVLAARYVSWRLTRTLLRISSLGARGVRSLPVEALAIVVILWQGPAVYKRVTGRTTNWETIAVLLALAGFVTLLARSRRRTVFQDFPDCTSPDSSGAVPGLSAYLANEVDRLGALYRQVQRERQVTKGNGRIDDPIQPTVELDDAADFLKDAVSPDAKLSLGPVSIPVGSILGLVARLMKGPQITGSLHREDDRLILLVHYEGARPRSWRVEGCSGSGETEEKGRWNLYPLVQEMAKRMLGDLTLRGTVKFPAVDAFTRAIQASLDDAGSTRSPLLRLIDVTDCLLEAIAADGSFDLAWYNLGVALLDLNDKEMARSVFMRARIGNPSRWEATYALAVLPGPAASRMLLCRQLIDSRPGSGAQARAYDLLGLLYTQEAAQRPADAREFSKLAVANRRMAARRAWHALWRAEWSARNRKDAAQLEEARRLALNCLTNLALSYKADSGIKAVAQQLRRATGVAAGLDKQAAVTRERSWANGQRFPSVRPLIRGGSDDEWNRRRDAHRDLRSRKRAMRRVRRPARQVELLLRQAGQLGPSDPRAHQELGTLNEELGNWKRAVDHYMRVLQARIDDPIAWVSVTNAAARTGRTRLLATQAVPALLALSPLVQAGQLRSVAYSLKDFDPETSEKLRRLAALDGQIGQVIAGARRGEQQALTRLDSLTQETKSLPDAAWAYYRCASARFRHGPPFPPMAPDPNVVKELLEATRRLDKECAPAVRKRNTNLAVAKDLVGRGQVTAALEHADKATRAAPFSPWAWQTLGDSLRGQTEFDEAEECYLKGLQWVIDHEQLVALTLSLTFCRLNRLQDDSADRSGDSRLLDARRRLEGILPSLKPDAIWPRIKIFYWLGQLALVLNDNARAISDFTTAAKLAESDTESSRKEPSILASSQAAKALIKAGQLDRARAAFDRVASAIEELEPNQNGLTATVSIGPGSLPLAEILIDARLNGAATLVTQERELAKATRLVELGREHLSLLSEEARIRCCATLETLLKQIEAIESRPDPGPGQPHPPDQPQ